MLIKLQKIIFILLLIFLPSQLGLHFWPEGSYINGVRIDYFSTTIYFTDILVFLLVILEGARRPIGSIFERFYRPSGSRMTITKKYLLICLVTGLLVLLNIYFSLSPFVSFYKWLKVLEFGFLVWWVYKNKTSLLTYLPTILLVTIVYSCLLALWQYFNHGSVGGLWYLLGERNFTFDTPGIAAGRPYATFPHPNVLIGFLLVASSLWLKDFPRISRKITVPLLLILASVCFLALSRGNLITGWNLRQQLNSVAMKQWSNSPIIGTGLGTSPLYPRNISNFAMLHQPIHNIYLLILSETGIVGLGLFGLLILKALRSKSIIHNSLFIILALGMFDHYWLTLQQTQLLFAIVLGIMWR